MRRKSKEVSALIPMVCLIYFFFLTSSECSKKARAGSNGWGECRTSAQNCEDRQSGAECGFINGCAGDAHAAVTDLYKRDAH